LAKKSPRIRTPFLRLKLLEEGYKKEFLVGSEKFEVSASKVAFIRGWGSS
jgi:hypothetical protein